MVKHHKKQKKKKSMPPTQKSVLTKLHNKAAVVYRALDWGAGSSLKDKKKIRIKMTVGFM